MEKQTRITLAGSLGSGKSSVGKKLARKLGIDFISTGEIFRTIGKVSNLNALQTNLAAETNSNIDAEVDARIVELAESDKSFVLDSRMAWHFVPDALNIYLYASINTAAERVFADATRDTEQYESIDIATDKLVQRRQSECARYQRLYNVDIDNIDNYSLFIVTDGAGVDDIVTLILDVLDKKPTAKHWLPKANLVPMMSIRELSGLRQLSATNVKQPEPVPLILENGLGYVFEEPVKLATTLMLGSKLVSFVGQAPTYVENQESLRPAADQLGASHFFDWEEVAGGELSITRLVAQGVQCKQKRVLN